MHATLRHLERLTDCTRHQAFTTLAQWQDRTYCAYRVAPSHNIIPKGNIIIRSKSRREAAWPAYDYVELLHPTGDLRDPRFLVTDAVLYLLCGAYLPHPAYGTTLLPASSDNLLQTHLTYTTDGDEWSTLVPVLRPNYWGWSGICAERGREGDGAEEQWVLASYHTGSTGEGSSIVLWTGARLLGPLLPACIYDGASVEGGDRGGFRYGSLHPSEPVLWWDAATRLLGGVVRTGAEMHLGVGRFPYQTADWRWQATDVRLHPSAVLATPEGLLLVGREIVETWGKRRGSSPRYETYTALYHVEGHQVTKLLRFPSHGDTGYAGLAPGDEAGTVQVSYYSQHEVPTGLPGAAVYVATVEVTA